MVRNDISHGRIQSTGELGQLVRVHRKSKGLTLETVAGLGNLSTRFLSEFERGKETAEIGKVLKALCILGLDLVVQPRSGGSSPSPQARPWPGRAAASEGDGLASSRGASASAGAAEADANESATRATRATSAGPDES